MITFLVSIEGPEYTLYQKRQWPVLPQVGHDYIAVNDLVPVRYIHHVPIVDDGKPFIEVYCGELSEAEAEFAFKSGDWFCSQKEALEAPD